MTFALNANKEIIQNVTLDDMLLLVEIVPVLAERHQRTKMLRGS